MPSLNATTVFHATTILAICRDGVTVFAGDGQVTVNNTIMKHSAVKLRSLHNGAVLSGFAGSAADAFTLFERFEGKLQESNGVLARAAVALAKDWRSDRVLRRLEAMMVVGDKETLYLLSGAGDVIQPDDGVVGIGSGGVYALSAARALLKAGRPDLSLKQIAEISMGVASEICPFTNERITVKEIGGTK